MRYIKVIIAIGIILTLGGCGGTVGKNFKISAVENIVNNTTTQMEIKNIRKIKEVHRFGKKNILKFLA